MAELIEHFSGTDVAIWAESEQYYYLGSVTLTPGSYYFTFTKSGTLPGKEGGSIHYEYSAGISGFAAAIGINSYGSTTSRIYDQKSTKEYPVYIYSNLSNFSSAKGSPQDERLTYDFYIYRLTEQELASVEESKRKSASKSRADESAQWSAWASADASAWREQSALMSAEWSAMMSESAYYSASRSASAWRSEHKNSLSASASKSAWQSISRLLSLERSAMASAEDSRLQSSALQSADDSRLRSSARQSSADRSAWLSAEDSRMKSSALQSAEDSRLQSSEQKSMLDSFYPSEVDSGSSENPTSPTSPTPSGSSGVTEESSGTPADSSIPDHFPSSSGTPQESSSGPEGASSSSVPTYSTDSSIPDHNPEESSGTPESGDGGSSGNSGDSGDDGEGITPGAAEDDCVYYPLAKITIKDGKVFVRQIARYVTPDLRLGAVIRERNENPETEE